MFVYEKKLQYPVKIKNTNPRLAALIISQYGGPDGELGASLRYLSQRFSMPYPAHTYRYTVMRDSVNRGETMTDANGNIIEIAYGEVGMNEKGVDKATGKVLIEVSPDFYRPTDVVNLWGDPTKARQELGWNPTKTSFDELVKIMVEHDMEKVAVERAEENIRCNGEMAGRHIRKYCVLGKEEETFMEEIFEKLALSARMHDRILKVARTTADLAGASEIRLSDLCEAVSSVKSREKFWGN